MNDLESYGKKGNANNAENDNSKQSRTNTTEKNDKITNPHNNKTDNKQKINLPSWIQAICSIILIFITGFYTYYASRQVCEMKKTVEEMGKQSIAMQTAANANRDAVDLAGKQFRMERRAFVHLSGFDKQSILDERKENVINYQITVKFKNSGATPTKNLHVRNNWTIRKEILPKNFDYRDLGEKGEGKPFFLPPNYEQEFSPLVFPTKVIIDVMNHAVHFYLYGWIKYYDRVGGEDEHITRFCYELADVNGGNPSNPTANISFGFKACSKNNCADEECKKQ
jgi:hypothetical protein